MDTPEILGIVGFCTLVVERFASHMTAKHKAEEWVRRKFDSLVDDLRKEHAECRAELAEIREILSFITPDTQDKSPAE